MDKVEQVVRTSFVGRFVGAALLRPEVYEDVERDETANGGALAVVLLSSVAAGFGARGFGAEGVAAAAFFTTVAIFGWAAWALVTYQIGVRLLPEAPTRADFGQLLRTTGFAAAPGVLRLLGAIPGLALPTLIVATVWMLAAMVVAIRQALDYTSTVRAVAVCVLGWTFAAGFVLLFGMFFGPKLS